MDGNVAMLSVCMVLELSKLEYGERLTGAEINSILEKLSRVPYVVRIYTHYYNPDLPLKNYFRPSRKGDFSQIEGGYSDGKATTKFDVVTTAKNAGQQNAALMDLSSFTG